MNYGEEKDRTGLPGEEEEWGRERKKGGEMKM